MDVSRLGQLSEGFGGKGPVTTTRHIVEGNHQVEHLTKDGVSAYAGRTDIQPVTRGNLWHASLVATDTGCELKVWMHDLVPGRVQALCFRDGDNNLWSLGRWLI